MLLGLEISGTAAAGILAHPDGSPHLALRQEFGPRATAANAWLLAMELVRTLLQRGELAPGQVTATGLAFFAPVGGGGVVERHPRGAGWEGFDLPRALREHVGLTSVAVASRASAEARGEHVFGALRGESQWLYVHLGSGIEAAVMCDGVLLQGAGGAAADLGAVTIDREGALDTDGRRGTLAAYCGEDAFLARARAYGITLASPAAVWDAAASSFAAQSVVDDFVSRLGQGIAAAAVLLNPGTICVGGGFGGAVFPRMREPLAQRLREYTPPRTFAPRAEAPLKLVAAALGDDGAAMGAVAMAAALAASRADDVAGG